MVCTSRRGNDGRCGQTENMSQVASPTVAAAAVDAYKIYGSKDSEVRALDGVTITFDAGRFTAIMGPSGSVSIGDDDLASLSDRQLTALRREKVGFIFQSYNLIPTLTALENITLPLDLGKSNRDQAWIDTVIDAVNLRDRLDHRPSELSGGQQQRVAVARALASKPHIIFADEPTGNLDSRTGAEILTFMKRAVAELGQTIVMVTHDPVAAAYADRVVFLGDGKVVDEMTEPTADRVLDRMKQFGS